MIKEKGTWLHLDFGAAIAAARDKCSAAVVHKPEGDWKHPIIDGSAIAGLDAMRRDELIQRLRDLRDVESVPGPYQSLALEVIALLEPQ